MYFNCIYTQWSNYSIIYEGALNMASDSEPREFFDDPEAPPEVTFLGIKMFFYCNFSTKNTCKLQ